MTFFNVAINQCLTNCQGDVRNYHYAILSSKNDGDTHINKWNSAPTEVAPDLVGSSKMELFVFDIQKEAVSIHQPLARVLAGESLYCTN